MNVRDVILYLLRFSGVNSLDPDLEDQSLNRRGFVPTDLPDALVAVNGAWQEISAAGPASLTEQSCSDVLRPPTQVSVAVTQYSAAVTVTGWQTWMAQCTARVGGDGTDNRFLSSTALLSPYLGTSGTVQATVYGDALAMDSRFLNIIEPFTADGRPLGIAADESQVLSGSQAQWQDGSDYVTQAVGYLNQKPVATPNVVFPDSVWDSSKAYLPIYLRFSPMPDRAYAVRFRAKLKPLVFTTADIGDATTVANSTIPADWVESILLPVALQKWMAHHSVNPSPGQMQEIGRAYQQAMRIVQDMVPRTGRVMPVYPLA